jgi:3D (Asp-Asp-Asp) domain-containing protein
MNADKLIRTRKGRHLSSRFGIKPIVFETTAYEGSFRSCGYWSRYHLTASGKRVRVGYIAADTRILPFHTKVYIEGIGVRVVEDRGGAIKGRKLDIYMNTVHQCLKWGRRKVKVYILPKEVAND